MPALGARVDLTDRRFGRWRVIRFDHATKRRGAFWLCRCECGCEKVILGYDMRAGRTRSCGCLSRDSTGKTEYEPSPEQIEAEKLAIRKTW